MEPTEQAKKEVEELNFQLSELHENVKKLVEERKKVEWHMVNAINKELNYLWRKEEKLEDRIDEIEKAGISSSEKRKIKKEVSGSGFGFYIIESEKSLGMKTLTFIGHSKTLDCLVKVDITKYTNFMIRGLARTSECDVTRITDEEYQALFNAGRTDRTVFCGVQETKRKLEVK